MKYDKMDLISAINRVAATNDGKMIFAELMHHCKWEQTICASDNPNVSLYYSALRGVYGSFRKAIDDEHLKSIEYDFQPKQQETV
jgi:hypothetical protein